MDPAEPPLSGQEPSAQQPSTAKQATSEGSMAQDDSFAPHSSHLQSHDETGDSQAQDRDDDEEGETEEPFDAGSEGSEDSPSAELHALQELGIAPSCKRVYAISRMSAHSSTRGESSALSLHTSNKMRLSKMDSDQRFTRQHNPLHKSLHCSLFVDRSRCCLLK